MSQTKDEVLEAPETKVENPTEQPDESPIHFKIDLTSTGDNHIQCDCALEGTGHKLIEVLGSLFMENEQYFEIVREAVLLASREKTLNGLEKIAEKLGEKQEEG